MMLSLVVACSLSGSKGPVTTQISPRVYDAGSDVLQSEDSTTNNRGKIQLIE